jgi:exosome complex RNA-binding protein Rrp4
MRGLPQYIPGAQDPVVGVVIARSGENYRVDIGGAHPATLDALAFEGASKRFRPNLKVHFSFATLRPFRNSHKACT